MAVRCVGAHAGARGRVARPVDEGGGWRSRREGQGAHRGLCGRMRNTKNRIFPNSCQACSHVRRLISHTRMLCELRGRAKRGSCISEAATEPGFGGAGFVGEVGGLVCYTIATK